MYFFFFFNDTATTEIYTLSLHDALPISQFGGSAGGDALARAAPQHARDRVVLGLRDPGAVLALHGDLPRHVGAAERSEEHTSELQSPCNLVCRLLLEKKKKHT